MSQTSDPEGDVPQPGVPVMPTDAEMVGILKRLASAHAHLTHAEANATDLDGRRDAVRNDAVEEAHTDLLWAQAQYITAAKEDRALEAIDQARRRERTVLGRYGFATFEDYLATRTAPPTADVHLEIARREYAAALAEWGAIQRQVAAADAMAATMVFDLTGDDPVRLA